MFMNDSKTKSGVYGPRHWGIPTLNSCSNECYATGKNCTAATISDYYFYNYIIGLCRTYIPG